MKIGQLLNILDKFSKEETRKLYILIESNYWQLSKNYRIFFLKILKHKSYSERKELWEKESKDNLRNFESRRIKITYIIEDFITMISRKENSISRQFALANFYYDKKLPENYEAKIESIQKQLKKSPVGVDTHLYKFQLYELILSRDRMIRKSTKIPILMYETLYQFYTDNHWRLKCEFYNHEARLNSLLSLEYEESTVSKVFQYIFKLFTDEKNASKHYIILKKHATELNKPELDDYMIKTIMIYLMNYSAQKINHGKRNFAIDYLFYVHYSIRHNFFLENNYLDPARYHNTIMAYLIDDSNDIKRIQQFIKEYSSHVFHEKNSKLVLQLMEAYILFFQGKYPEVNTLLKCLEYRTFSTIHKVLLAKLKFKIFYEQTQDYDDKMKALKRIENFAIKKTDLTIDKKEAYLSFYNLAKKLINQRLTKDIILQHPKYISVLDRIWLLKKCER